LRKKFGLIFQSGGCASGGSFQICASLGCLAGPTLFLG
jgi:hypothetical protein